MLTRTRNLILPVPEMEFTDEEEWLALSAVLARLDEFEAKKDNSSRSSHWTSVDIQVGMHSEKRYAKLQESLPSSFW